MKSFFTTAFWALSFTYVFAQEYQGFEISPLSHNRPLETAKQPLKSRGIPDSINLPFVDDFSYSGPYPDPDLWLDNKVFVNNAMGINPPSVGVATFDAIDAKGRPYGVVGNWGTADTLTSNYINLKDFVGTDGIKRNLTINDNILMSFFLQPKGLAYAPAESDSIVLEFRDINGTWSYVKGYKGIPDSTLRKNPLNLEPPFTYYTVSINEAKYLYSKFQFRFYNYGRLGGAYESWHLDYVKIAPNRVITNKSLDDLAYVEVPKPALKRYTSMPWKQAFAQLSTELRDSFSAKFYNNFSIVRNVTNTNLKVTTSTGVTAADNYTVGDALNIPPSVFFSTAGKAFPSSFKQQLATIPNTTPKVTVTTEYNLSIEGQEGKDLKKMAVQNDAVRSNTVFDNYYAYDDGTAEMQFSLTGDGMQAAVRFRANVADSLRGVMFFFPYINGNAPKDAAFNLKIWKDSLNTTPIFTMTDVQPFYLTSLVDSLQGFTSYKTLDASGKAIPIPAGDFYVGWQNVGNIRIPVGLDRNNIDKTQYLYQTSNGKWIQVSTSTPIIGAVMLRPILGNDPVRNSSTLKVNEIPLAEVMTVSPNPATHYLHFDIKKGMSEDYEISIFNIAGQLQKREILRGSELGLEGLRTGIYFLKIRDLKNNLIFNHKFAVQNQ